MESVERTTAAAGGRSLAVRAVSVVAASVAANVGLVLAAGALALAPGFRPLDVGPVAVLSAAGAVGAVAVYALLGRYASDPDRTFRRVAAAALVVSFVPDLALLAFDPAATVAGVAVLMVMHVVVAAAAVGLFAGLRSGRR